MKHISTEKFLQMVDRLRFVEFDGLEDYRAQDYFFLPLYLALATPEVKRPLRHCVTPFFGGSADYNILGCTENPNTILFYSERYRGRRDMDAIIENVEACIDRPLVFWGIHKRKLDVRALSNLRRIRSWNKTLKRLGVNKEKRPYLLGQLARACNFKRFLDEHKTLIGRASSFVTLWDQDYDEALFTKFCQKMGMKTATLQHGIFYGEKEHGNDLRTYPYCYKHLNADYFFAWGECSRQYAAEHNISQEKIVVVGNPKYLSGSKSQSRLAIEKKYDFCLFLDGGYLRNHTKNLRMLKMAQSLCKERNLRALVKAHPDYGEGEQQVREALGNSSAIKLVDKNASVLELASLADFFIMSGSTVYAEALFLGVPTLRYIQGDAPDVFSRYSLGVFQDESQLIEQFDGIRANLTDFARMQKKIADALCVQEDSPARYRSALDALARGDDPNMRLSKLNDA